MYKLILLLVSNLNLIQFSKSLARVPNQPSQYKIVQNIDPGCKRIEDCPHYFWKLRLNNVMKLNEDLEIANNRDVIDTPDQPVKP